MRSEEVSVEQSREGNNQITLSGWQGVNIAKEKKKKYTTSSLLHDLSSILRYFKYFKIFENKCLKL